MLRIMFGDMANMRKTYNMLIVSLLLISSGCIIDKETPSSGVRSLNRENGALAREGLAFSRLLSSPLSVPLYMGHAYNDLDDGKPMRIGYTDPLTRSFNALTCGVIGGAFIMCGEVVVSLPELLTTTQFKSVYYPWETFTINEREPRLEARLKDPELRRVVEESKGRLAVKTMKAAEVAIDIAGEVANEVVEEAVVAGVESAINKNSRSSKTIVSRSSDANSRGVNGMTKPRVMHSSCRGTGRCHICKGKGIVGKDIICSGCGGTLRCRACRGLGYVE